MAHKDFGAAPEGENVDLGGGPTFTIAGRKFETFKEPTAGVWADAVEARGDKGWDIASIRRFVRGCVLPDQVATFEEVLRLPHVNKDVLVEVFEFVVGEYTARPSTPPSG